MQKDKKGKNVYKFFGFFFKFDTRSSVYAIWILKWFSTDIAYNT